MLLCQAQHRLLNILVEGKRSGMASNFNQGHIGGVLVCSVRILSTASFTELHSSCVQHSCAVTGGNGKAWQEREAWEITKILLLLCRVLQDLCTSGCFSAKKKKPKCRPVLLTCLQRNVDSGVMLFKELRALGFILADNFPIRRHSQMLQGKIHCWKQHLHSRFTQVS